MCDVVTPTMLAYAALTTAAVGTGISAYASYQSGQSQKQAGEYNAEMDDLRAKDSLQRGADEARDVQQRARKIASSQVEGSAMSGVNAFSGSPLALLTETAGLGELDALRTVNNAKREAWGYSAQSKLDLFQGNAAGKAGMLNAGGSLLTGAANSYYGYKSATSVKG